MAFSEKIALHIFFFFFYKGKFQWGRVGSLTPSVSCDSEQKWVMRTVTQFCQKSSTIVLSCWFFPLHLSSCCLKTGRFLLIQSLALSPRVGVINKFNINTHTQLLLFCLPWISERKLLFLVCFNHIKLKTTREPNRDYKQVFMFSGKVCKLTLKSSPLTFFMHAALQEAIGYRLPCCPAPASVWALHPPVLSAPLG